MNYTENISLPARKVTKVSRENNSGTKSTHNPETRFSKTKEEEETYVNLYQLVENTLITNNRIYLLAAIAFFAIGKML